MKRKILITGINGFAGPYLADYLNSQGFEIWGLDINDPAEPAAENIIMGIADICSQEQIETILAECNPEAIYHLAAQSSVAVSWQKPVKTMQINLEGTINLLEAVKKLKLDTRILLVGSGEEYGTIKPEELPITEEHETNPQNPYSLSKLFQTIMGMHYLQTDRMQIYFTRAFNHTGPGQHQGFVIPDFASQIARIEAGLQKPVINVGNLSAQRDFCDVRDVVRAYHKIIEQGKPGRIYNVASGKAVMIQDILDQLIGLSDKPVQVKIDPQKFRPVDVPVIYASTDRIKKETGWQPKIGLQDTIKDTLEFWRMQKKEIDHPE